MFVLFKRLMILHGNEFVLEADFYLDIPYIIFHMWPIMLTFLFWSRPSGWSVVFVQVQREMWEQ